jgi:hypothetical protein
MSTKVLLCMSSFSNRSWIVGAFVAHRKQSRNPRPLSELRALTKISRSQKIEIQPERIMTI